MKFYKQRANLEDGNRPSDRSERNFLSFIALNFDELNKSEICLIQTEQIDAQK